MNLKDLVKEVIREELSEIMGNPRKNVKEASVDDAPLAKKRKKLHWTKDPRNAKKVAAMIRKMQRARKAAK